MKEIVRERDGCVCTRCGMTDAQHRVIYNQAIQIHRVVPGSEYTVDGCVTVCQACHGKLPKRPRSGIKKASRPGMTPVYFELPDDLAADLEKLVASLPLGSKADHIRLAIDRHLKTPPTVAVPDVPPLALPATEPAKKPRSPRRSKK